MEFLIIQDLEKTLIKRDILFSNCRRQHRKSSSNLGHPNYSIFDFPDRVRSKTIEPLIKGCPYQSLNGYPRKHILNNAPCRTCPYVRQRLCTLADDEKQKKSHMQNKNQNENSIQQKKNKHFLRYFPKYYHVNKTQNVKKKPFCYVINFKLNV